MTRDEFIRHLRAIFSDWPSTDDELNELIDRYESIDDDLANRVYRYAGVTKYNYRDRHTEYACTRHAVRCYLHRVHGFKQVQLRRTELDLFGHQPDHSSVWHSLEVANPEHNFYVNEIYTKLTHHFGE